MSTLHELRDLLMSVGPDSVTTMAPQEKVDKLAQLVNMFDDWDANSLSVLFFNAGMLLLHRHGDEGINCLGLVLEDIIKVIDDRLKEENTNPGPSISRNN